MSEFHEMPFVEPSNFLRQEMTNDCGDCFRSQFASIPGVTVREFSRVHSQPLQVKSAQILVGRSLGKMSMALISCLVRKNMPMSVTWHCLAGLVAPLLLALDGSCFCTLVWGGQVTLHIAALILGVLWKGRSIDGIWSRGTHI
jgi:hypothetical protein